MMERSEQGRGRAGWALWRRWVAANALGEFVGLGATLALGAWAIPQLEGAGGAGAVLLAFGVAVASGGD